MIEKSFMQRRKRKIAKWILCTAFFVMVAFGPVMTVEAVYYTADGVESSLPKPTPKPGVLYGEGKYVPTPTPTPTPKPTPKPGVLYDEGKYVPTPKPTLGVDDPFYYLSSKYEKELAKITGFKLSDEKTKQFTAEWYQVLKYASISGATLSGLACIIVWSVTHDGNKRSEKSRALLRTCVYLIAVCSLSWILSMVFEVFDKLR